MTSLTRRRRGFTLVEVLFAMLIAAAVLLVAWMFFFSGSRQLASTQAKLSALRSAHGLFELLHRDLKNAREVVVSGGSSLFFIDGKEYVFDPASRRLLVAGKPWILGYFTEVSAKAAGEGRIDLRLVATEFPPGDPGEARQPRGHGRAVIESCVVVERLRDFAHFPYLISERAAQHTYCMTGDPVDH